MKFLWIRRLGVTLLYFACLLQASLSFALSPGVMWTAVAANAPRVELEQLHATSAGLYLKLPVKTHSPETTVQVVPVGLLDGGWPKNTSFDIDQHLLSFTPNEEQYGKEYTVELLVKERYPDGTLIQQTQMLKLNVLADTLAFDEAAQCSY